MSEWIDDCCPGCGHSHPRRVGVRVCGCYDCSLWWSDIPFELLGDTAKHRLQKLLEWANTPAPDSPTVDAAAQEVLSG